VKRLILLLAFLARVASATPDDMLYTALLQDHVKGIAVDYAGLAQDERLDAYLGQIAATDPVILPSDDARLALWINAYNAYTLKLVTSVEGISSIREIKAPGKRGDPDTNKPWDQPFAIVGGTTYTLNQIENEIIRPRFNDPRIHYALVCAAFSCPSLRREAYVAERLDAQLDKQGRWFLKHRNQFDAKRRTAGLSQILNWYGVDFGDDQASQLRTLAEHVTSPAVANSLRNEPHHWTVTYLDYDWSLNNRAE
jgi:hypothetical protein